MRRIALIVVACLASAVPAARSRPSASSRREIRELEAQFARAVVAGDRAFFDRVLADDFTHTSHSGVFKTRAEWMAEDKVGRPKGDPRPVGHVTTPTTSTTWRSASTATRPW